MSRFRLCPSPMQERLPLEHCAHARYVWNLAVEQHSHREPGRASAPGFAEQCRQLTEARGESEWLRSGSVNVRQQALRDFWRTRSAFFKSGFGHPAWRRKHHDEGFRITDTCDVERLNIVTMTASARGTTEKPGRNVAQKAGLNRAILAQGWGLLRNRTENKAPGRVQDVPAPYTSLRCSCLRVDRQEIAQEPSRFRLFSLRLHLQRGPQRSN